MAEIAVSVPTFLLQVGANGQITVFQITSGDLTGVTLAQLFTAQRDIAGAAKLLEALIIRNLT
jgi:hypothetical protein